MVCKALGAQQHRVGKPLHQITSMGVEGLEVKPHFISQPLTFIIQPTSQQLCRVFSSRCEDVVVSGEEHGF